MSDPEEINEAQPMCHICKEDCVPMEPGEDLDTCKECYRKEFYCDCGGELLIVGGCSEGCK